MILHLPGTFSGGIFDDEINEFGITEDPNLDF